MVRRADERTIVWVTGGSDGLGAALLAGVPFTGCRRVNIARRAVDGVTNVTCDLSTGAGWDAVRAQVTETLRSTTWERAIFVHNAAASTHGSGFAGEADLDAFRSQVLLNAAAPMILGATFLSLCPPGLDAGLVLLGSASADRTVLGRAGYAAAKAGVENWVRGVRAERRVRGSGPWVIGVRPGTVDTPGLRSAMSDPAMPQDRREQFERHRLGGRFLAPEAVAQRIWAMLPPGDDSPDIVSVGESMQ